MIGYTGYDHGGWVEMNIRAHRENVARAAAARDRLSALIRPGITLETRHA